MVSLFLALPCSEHLIVRTWYCPSLLHLCPEQGLANTRYTPVVFLVWIEINQIEEEKKECTWNTCSHFWCKQVCCRLLLCQDPGDPEMNQTLTPLQVEPGSKYLTNKENFGNWGNKYIVLLTNPQIIISPSTHFFCPTIQTIKIFSQTNNYLLELK